VQFKDGEEPFEIPDNWRWVTLSTISETITKGTTPKGGDNAYVLNGIRFLRAENVLGYNILNIENTKFISCETHLNELSRSVLKENDILITIAGTLGRTAIVRKEQLPLNTNQAIAFVRPLDSSCLNLNFIIYAVNSPVVKQILLKQKKITAIPNLSLQNIAELRIPFPPLEEQNRIVVKLEQILPFIEGLS
jgi:type I restriction enzyme S subunit